MRTGFLSAVAVLMAAAITTGYSRVDKPFQDVQGRLLENFTRVEMFLVKSR